MRAVSLITLGIVVALILLLNRKYGFFQLPYINLTKLEKSVLGSPCITEGENGNYFNQDRCCRGLTGGAIGSDKPPCSVITNGGFVCINYGDGKCSKGENLCNSPQDCK